MTSFNLFIHENTILQIRPHLEVMEVRIPTYLFWEDTIQVITFGACLFKADSQKQEYKESYAEILHFLSMLHTCAFLNFLTPPLPFLLKTYFFSVILFPTPHLLYTIRWSTIRTSHTKPCWGKWHHFLTPFFPLSLTHTLGDSSFHRERTPLIDRPFRPNYETWQYHCSGETSLGMW